jgi:hypothetical protein
MTSSKEKLQGGTAILNRIPLWALASIAFALVLGMGISGFVLGTKGQTVQDQKTATEGRLETAESKVQTGVQLAGENLKLCQDPAIINTLRDNGYQHVCDLAIIVQTQAAEPGAPGKQGERGPGPTQTQVNAAVEDYFRAHPLPEGKSPTVEQVANAVGTYLRTTPPEPGRPPTADEIAMATAAYIADHAHEFQGPEGKQGEPGRPPTADEVRAAVATYCADNGGCRGAQGPQGTGITAAKLRRDDQQICTLYLTWENPADGSTGEFAVQVDDGMCPPPAATPSTSGGG